MKNLQVFALLCALLISGSALHTNEHNQDANSLPNDGLGEYQAQYKCPFGFNEADEYWVKCNEPAHWNPATKKCFTCDPNEPWNPETHQC